MSEKTAFIFDTNFIIQHIHLDKVLSQLKEKYNVYVTQMSIEERIAQYCRENEKVFKQAEKLQDKYGDLIEISFKKTIEEWEANCKSVIQKNYEYHFPNNIISFSTGEETLEFVINRSNKKLPPFSDAKDASDKGFKDCIIWFSILEYFKKHGEKKVLFLTGDRAFLNHSDFLVSEFNKKTGKTIEIKPNSYFDEIYGLSESNDDNKKHNDNVSDIKIFRRRISEKVELLCNVEFYNYFGDESYERTFTTNKPFDKGYTKQVFDNLEYVFKKHIFEESLPASKVLDFDGRITNGNMEIPIENLEEVIGFYYDVKRKYTDSLDQFYEAASKIFNYNYIEPYTPLNDDDLPF